MEIFQKLSVEMEDSEEEFDVDRPALMVPPPLEDEDLTKPPMTGEQYLRRVIEEAKLLESVKIADTSKMTLQTNCKYQKLPEVKPCGEDLLPSKDWQLASMADFSQLRLEMEELREKMSPYKCSIISNILPKEDDEEERWLNMCVQKVQRSSQNPSTELCLALSQAQLYTLLSYLGDWIKNGDISVKDGCRWAYCLLACLQLPIESDVYFHLRQIARALINSRSLLESLKSEDLPHMNLLICIIGRYFNQIDLADPFVEAKN